MQHFPSVNPLMQAPPRPPVGRGGYRETTIFVILIQSGGESPRDDLILKNTKLFAWGELFLVSLKYNRKQINPAPLSPPTDACVARSRPASTSFIAFAVNIPSSFSSFAVN
jgi:hypothetical protein